VGVRPVGAPQVTTLLHEMERREALKERPPGRRSWGGAGGRVGAGRSREGSQGGQGREGGVQNSG